MRAKFVLYAQVFLVLLAFAANSLLCRAALAGEHIDAASFTLLRIASGALTLLVLTALSQHSASETSWQVRWSAALSLFVYAAGFSLAYIHLDAGFGALLLFGSVQLTMLTGALIRGERLQRLQWVGLIFAIAGLTMMLAPDSLSPSVWASLTMVVAGGAWGIFSLLGRKAKQPLIATCHAFILALPLGVVMVCVWLTTSESYWNLDGILLAIVSGSVTSGLGYALWYRVLPSLSRVQASGAQLSVPVVALLLGVVLLGESVSGLLLLICALVLGGCAMIVFAKPQQ